MVTTRGRPGKEKTAILPGRGLLYNAAGARSGSAGVPPAFTQVPIERLVLTYLRQRGLVR